MSVATSVMVVRARADWLRRIRTGHINGPHPSQRTQRRELTGKTHRVCVFRLADGGVCIDQDEAKRRVAQARLPMPPRVSSVRRSHRRLSMHRSRSSGQAMQRRVPSLPTMPWQDDGR